MGQASSARSRGSSASARVSRPFAVDGVTGLPLIDCPRCGDVRLIALTCKHTRNRGKRFFKCPRNHEGARSFSLEVIPVPLKLKNLFGYCETWDTSVALELDHIAELSAGVEMPGIGARLHARISFLSEDWLKSSLKKHVMGVSVGLLSTMNHSLAYNLIWRNLTDPARMSSNSIQEHLGHSLLSSIKYAYKVDQRDSSIRPTRGYAFLSSSQVGCLAPGSKDSLCLRQEVDLRFAFPVGVLNGALNAGMAAGLILPLERKCTGSVMPLSERFYLDGNRSLVCRLGGPSSLSGFKAKGLGPKDFGTSAPNNSENGASASPELHGGGDIAVTAFADLSFDFPLKLLRELGIHGHTFISAGNLAKLTEHGRGKFSLTGFLQTFRSSAGFGVVVPTRLFRIEMKYCYILKQFDHDRGKAGVQLTSHLPNLFGTWQHHLTLGTSLLDVDVNALDWNDGIVFVQGSRLNQPTVRGDKWLLASYIVLTISAIVFLL